ncbi:GAF domain-containing sensor histidine kinase [Dactylosporangium sp. NBC_01737]|uniref:GAF domain-containing sensor histidine kinase n=1 Tax=Dactylosporangium sp. NBC_01737 TaxID=2975959 RepID=UPI002E1351BF|nr:GAF domain-containing sensor histidine kinase [Dactylosporangium sp. NBC_01737]
MAACDRDELREVSAAVLAVTAHLSVREVLQTIVAAARRLLDAEYAALGIPDGNGSFREFLADGLSDAQWRAIGPLPRQHGLLGAMLRDPSPVRSADIRTHPRFEGWPSAHPEMVDFLGMPIVDGDEILGEIFLANKRRPTPAQPAADQRPADGPSADQPSADQSPADQPSADQSPADQSPADRLPAVQPAGDRHHPRQHGGFDADDEELLRLLAAHAAIAIINARLYERSRELSIVEERQRIARELHDAVTQKLFSLRLTAEAASALVTRDPQRAVAELDTVRRLAADATAELKSIVVGLRPADLAGDGLATALQRQAELLDRVHAARIRFTGDQLPKLSEERQEAAYRVAQEALHNALRHGDPRHVDIHLRRSGRGFTLRITDDGTGFDTTEAGSTRPGQTNANRTSPSSTHASSTHASSTTTSRANASTTTPDKTGAGSSGAAAQRRLGLASMRERARSVGGRLTVTSRPGTGTTVTMEVPGGC